MTSGNTLFSQGDLMSSLNHEFNKITEAVAKWDEDSLLTTPEPDICGELEHRFFVDPLVLDRDGITADSVKEGYTTVRQFDEEVRLRQTVVTISIPFTGDKDLFQLRPSSFTWNPPAATIQGNELKLQWMGPEKHDPQQVRASLDHQLNEIQKWVDWSTAQVKAHNEAAVQRIAAEVQTRKARVLANRNLQANLGFCRRTREYAQPRTGERAIGTNPPRPAEAAGRPWGRSGWTWRTACGEEFGASFVSRDRGMVVGDFVSWVGT